MTHKKALSILNLNYLHDDKQLIIAYKNKIKEFPDNISVSKEIYEAYLFLREELYKSNKSQKYAVVLNNKKEKVIEFIKNDTSMFGSEYFANLPKTMEYAKKAFSELSENYINLIEETQIISEVDSLFSKYKKDLICINQNFVKIGFNEWYLSQNTDIPKEQLENIVYEHFGKLYTKPFFEIGMELTKFLYMYKIKINEEKPKSGGFKTPQKNTGEIFKNLANMYSLQYKDATKNNKDAEKYNLIFQRLINLIKGLSLQENINAKIIDLLTSIDLKDIVTTEKIVSTLEKVTSQNKEETPNKII